MAFVTDTDLAATGAGQGASMVGFIQGGTGSVSRATLEKLRERVSVLDFGAVGDGVTDDTSAFQAAVDTGRPVYVPSRGGNGDTLVYSVGDVVLAAGTHISGDGMGRTVVRPNQQPSGDFSGVTPVQKVVFFCDSGSTSATVKNITLRDMTLYGWVEDNDFFEFNHLASFNGVENLLVENVEFKAFQGDGLYIGASRGAGVQRINRNVTVRGCVFDGVTNDNRNGTSFISIDGAIVENCTYIRCTRSNMPGPLDFEPDPSSFHVIRNISVIGCRFADCGGNLGQVSVQVPVTVTAVPAGITIQNNHFENKVSGQGSDISINLNRVLAATDPEMSVTITGNTGANGVRPLEIRSVKGAVFRDNTWTGYSSSSILGFTDADDLVRNVLIEDSYKLCGSSSNVALEVFDADDVTINGLFEDCGAGTAGAAAINFNAGASANIRIGATITAPTGKTLVAVRKEAGHTFTPATNVDNSRTASGIGTFFESANRTPVALTYSNGWSTYGDTGIRANAGVTLDRRQVSLQGTIKGGTTTPGTIMATLPAGYRPSGILAFPVVSSNQFGAVRILANGNITTISVTAADVSLDGISFRAA